MSDQRPTSDDDQIPQTSFLVEFVGFLKCNKRWWLTPILFAICLLLIAAILLPSRVKPFIYSFL
ncbi:MAG: DUF5989 family protein [Rubripirellula sp.]|jgi:hypothetical protein|nr:hypothetical protein [Planctomycetaceae bacterium]MDF1841474.1 DUF5989 family protein [Rubripirellula sp.]